jgi:hypothetical protein
MDESAWMKKMDEKIDEKNLTQVKVIGPHYGINKVLIFKKLIPC